MSFMDSFLAEGSEIRGILEDFDSPSGKGLIMGMAILIEAIAKKKQFSKKPIRLYLAVSVVISLVDTIHIALIQEEIYLFK